VISGVEPQRSIFENELIKVYENYKEKVLIVQGQPQSKIEEKQIGNVRLISHLDTKSLAAYLVGTKQIICRSGYSSIMDLATLNCLKKSVLIATSGQTEQEYLADKLKD
jgi:predicted glycosyltransferase